MSKYRPANGSEGLDFMAKFCHRCARDAKFRETQDGEDSCPIARDALMYAVTDEGYPEQWIEDALGARCTEFEAA